MAIYTCTGDAGATVLFAGQRVSKTHPRVEAYGMLDKLNATLSLCACVAKTPQHQQLFENTQLQPFWFSAELASESEKPTPEQRYTSSEEIMALETAIDTAMGGVLSLRSSIPPGRREAASRPHSAHTPTRRAERRLAEFSIETSVRHVLMRYINCLSGYLYAFARAEDHDVHQNDIIQEVAERYLAAAQASAIKEPIMPLSFQELHQLTRAAAMRAEGLQVPVVISIVDANETQTVAWRVPDALFVSSELAPKKARTAVAMKTATHELTLAVQPDAALYGLESHMQGKVVTFGGGCALWCEGLLLGGLGISRGGVEQDMDTAETTTVAISMGTHQ